MDLERFKTLIELVADTPISELELTEGSVRVKITKSPDSGASKPVPSSAIPSRAMSADDEPSGRVPEKHASSHLVRAPMFGTFFSAPSPSDPPFVREGDAVTKGQTICIIEAMKTLTHISADQDGVVAKILAENGSIVEFDQPLFEIR